VRPFALAAFLVIAALALARAQLPTPTYPGRPMIYPIVVSVPPSPAVLGTGTSSTDCLGTGTSSTDCLGIQ